MRIRVVLACLVTSAFASTPVLAAEPDGTLSLWTRGKGSYSDGRAPAPMRPMTLRLDEMKPVKRRLRDVQYDRQETYLGVPLAKVIERYDAKAPLDTVILHFRNGMAVPVPLDDDSLTRLKAFVALRRCEAKAPCQPTFPEVTRDNAFGVTDDPRPITFGWNKLAVPTPWHPSVPEARARLFSPWRHADTLTGLEFVVGDAYRAQFAVGVAEGARVFEERCQFCHGVRQVGASFGWDFVTPLPIYEKRRPEHLLNHVKYPKALAMDMGLMMPTQKDVTLPEIEALWRWLRRAAAQPVRAYAP